MSTCEVTQVVVDTWAACPTLLRCIWARNRRAGFRHCTSRIASRYLIEKNSIDHYPDNPTFVQYSCTWVRLAAYATNFPFKTTTKKHHGRVPKVLKYSFSEKNLCGILAKTVRSFPDLSPWALWVHDVAIEFLNELVSTFLHLKKGQCLK